MFDFNDLNSPVSFCGGEGGGGGGGGGGVGQCTASDPSGTSSANNDIDSPSFGETAAHIASNAGIGVEVGTGNIGISGDFSSCGGCHDPFGSKGK